MSNTMIEVRSVGVSSGDVGVFATQDFAIGDLIMEDASPIVALAPFKEDDTRKLLAALPPGRKGGPKDDDGEPLFMPTINPPATLQKDSVGKFLGMIQVLACYTELLEKNDDCLAKILNLYTPSASTPTPEEEAIVKGGRIYDTQCRVNHSCNPNAILQADGDLQRIRAAATIKAGDEITISYLGLMLYADRTTRQSQLALHKHFQCRCDRCCQGNDAAAAIPCTTCHAREGRYLEEDVAFDDDKDVHYMYPRGESREFECLHCKTKLASNDTDGKSGGPIALVASVSKKVLKHLQDKETGDDDEGAEMIDEEWEDNLHQLAYQVAGTLHWTTNLISLMRLSRELKQHHATMIQTGQNPEVEDIADAIDKLERLCRFFEGLQLDLHMGHVLSTSIVGVARTLVSLGDEKSKKYAAEWVGKIKDYSDIFESEGMQKVTTSLMEAWEKSSEEGPAKKKKKAK